MEQRETRMGDGAAGIPECHYRLFHKEIQCRQHNDGAMPQNPPKVRKAEMAGQSGTVVVARDEETVAEIAG